MTGKERWRGWTEGDVPSSFGRHPRPSSRPRLPSSVIIHPSPIRLDEESEDQQRHPDQDRAVLEPLRVASLAHDAGHDAAPHRLDEADAEVDEPEVVERAVPCRDAGDPSAADARGRRLEERGDEQALQGGDDAEKDGERDVDDDDVEGHAELALLLERLDLARVARG